MSTPKLYAVTRNIQRQEIRPYGECLEVVKENKYYLVVKGSRFGRGEDGTMKIHRRNVLFYTDHDVTEAIKNANFLVNNNFQVHLDYVKRIMLVTTTDHATLPVDTTY